MRLGISYNLFDGEELITDSIKTLRDNVDYISVIVQRVSNFGLPAKDNLKELLVKLKQEKLIDEIYLYIPNMNNPHQDETIKRQIGLELSRNNACTHHLSIDTDEFYDIEEFKKAKDVIELNNFDSSSCQMQSYYKKAIYQVYPAETYYVPFIYKIRDNIGFEFNSNFPTFVDPTRRMQPGKHKIFTRDELQMHHMTYVREDISIKLSNSSARSNFKNVDKIINYYNNYEYPQKALFIGAGETYFDVNIVENKFNIKVNEV
jgi:hypothetical protein